jgi:hypothetical protein
MRKSSSWNPLAWLRDVQDWFIRAEKSSGFRPYLVFLILVFGLSLFLLKFFSNLEGIRQCAIFLIALSTGAFIILFAIKAFQDPDFARSETHVQRMRKYDLEMMGTESDMIEGQIVERQLV